MSNTGRSLSAHCVQPALLQRPTDRGIRCLTCERRCEIGPDSVGWCRTRRRQDGQLVTLAYGAISSLSANPIEKKPLYHFHPGTVAHIRGLGVTYCRLDGARCPGRARPVPGVL